MENRIEIKKNDLKDLILLLINKLDDLNNNYFSPRKDLYWNIPDNELYNVYEEPKELSIGSIKDDWDFLQKILNEKRDIVGYDFVKISSILKLIGHNIG